MKRVLFFVILFFTGASLPAQKYIETGVEYPQAYLQASFDAMGESVALGDGVLFVGEPGYDNGRGRLNIYRYNGKEWKRIREITAPGGAGSRFGYSLSLYGDTLVVGAPGDDACGEDCGAVYIYGKPAGGWEELKKSLRLLPPEPVEGGEFGKAVALWRGLLVTGSPNKNIQGGYGSVYLYIKGKEWVEKTPYVRLYASDANGDNTGYGFGVDVWDDVVVVGAPLKRYGGGVYLFEQPEGGWKDMNETARLRDGGGNNRERMGYSVCIREGVVFAGTYSLGVQGEVFVFERPVTGWEDNMLPTAHLTASDGSIYDFFGYAVTADTMGQEVAVGCRNGADNGAVYIFRRPAAGWSDLHEEARLVASDGRKGDDFGKAVAMWGDFLAAGVPGKNLEGTGSGAVYIFRKKIAWQDLQEEQQRFLPEIYLSSQGDELGQTLARWGEYAVAGAPGYDQGRGRAYVYHREGDVWRRVAVLTAAVAAAGDRFGTAVAIYGTTVVIGAEGYNEYSGRVYLFERPPGGWHDMTETCRLAPRTVSEMGFGEAVAAGDGFVVAGAPLYNGSGYLRGRAYLFERPDGGWTDMHETARLIPSDSSDYKNFGWSLAVSGTTVAVGAPGDKQQGSNAGAVYIFERPAAGWQDLTEMRKVTAPEGAAGDKFGTAVALDSTLLAVGAPEEDDAGNSSGAAWLFPRPGEGWQEELRAVRLGLNGNHAFSYFGTAMTVLQNEVAVGAPGEDINDYNEGAVYIFRKPDGGWRDTAVAERVVVPGINAGARLGRAVALGPRCLLAGAPYDDRAGIMAGSVTYFREYDPVRITCQPHDTTDVCAETTVSFTVAAENAEQYRWQVSRDGGITFSALTDDTVYSGTATDTLRVLFIPPPDSTRYRCEISNAAYHIFTDSVLLTLDALPPAVEVRDTLVYLDTNGVATLNMATIVTDVADNCGVADTLVEPSSFSCNDGNHSRRVRIRVTDVYGNMTTDSVWVTVLDTVAPRMTVHNDTVWLDENGEGGVTAAGVITALWDNCGIHDTLFSVSGFTCDAAGTTVPVTLTAVDIHDNRTERTLEVTVLDTVAPVLDVQNAEVTVTDGDTAVLNAVALVTRAYDYCGVADTVVTPRRFTAGDTGTVTVTVLLTDRSGNVTRKNAEVTVFYLTGIESDRAGTTVSLRPNPAGGHLLVDAGDAGIRRLEVYNLTGAPVASCSGEGTLFRLDLSSLPAGVYLLRVTTTRGVSVRRFVKK